MENLRLLPTPHEQEDPHQETRQSAGGPLGEEVSVLRGALRLVYSCLQNRTHDGNVPIFVGTMCRLSDSIVRALLAAQKLDKSSDQLREVQDKIDRIFKALGWEEQPVA